MPWIILAVVIVGFVALFVVFTARGYSKVFSGEHYVEVARGIAKTKAGALGSVIQGDDQPVLTPGDPRVLVTSHGLALAYTIRQAPEGFVHHYSISMPGQPTTGAVGQTFTLYVAHLLGVSPEQLATEVSPAAVHHAEFVLTPDGEAKFVSWKVRIPTAEEAREIHTQCQQIRVTAGK